LSIELLIDNTRTVVSKLDERHCITIALACVIDAVLIDPALTGVLIVVIGTGPEIPLNSIQVVPPRLLNAAKFKRGAKTIVLHCDSQN
jgi:hypothetical protein